MSVFLSGNAQTSESFSNIGLGSGYSSGSFTGDAGIIWFYENAKGGQYLTSNETQAICLNKAADATLYNNEIEGGCSKLTFGYEQEYSSDVLAHVYINDSLIATITSSSQQDSTLYFLIDSLTFEGNINLRIQQASAESGHLTIDDISIYPYTSPNTVGQLLNTSVYSDTIILVFSKNIDQNRLSERKFQLSGDNLIVSYECIQNKIAIIIQKEECGTDTLSITNLFDEFGLLFPDTIVTIRYTNTPNWGDIVFTEIMYDPAPVIDLPEVEYVEIFNRSECAFSLSDIIFENRDDHIELPDSVIPPNTYMVLADNDFYSEIASWFNVVSVSSLPALINDRANLQLRNKQNELIAFFEYSPSMHISKFKEEGGWSLEIIDYNNLCDYENNWTSCENLRGGTPGAENSVSDVNSDIISPEISFVECVSDTILIVHFSEFMEHSGSLGQGSFSIEGSEIKVAQIKIPEVISDYVILYLNQKINSKYKYNLQCKFQFADCSGNTSSSSNVAFAMGELPEYTDVIINEILFDPISEGADFVEIYNRSIRNVSFSNLYIASKNKNGEIDEFYRLTEENRILFPGEFYVISEDCSNIQENYHTQDTFNCIEPAEMPGLAKTEGNVQVILRTGDVVDELYYTDDMHFELLNSKEGVSLEKISYDVSSSEESNWQSASEMVGFATPGYINSQYVTKRENSEMFSLNTDLFSPNADGFNDNLLFRYQFANPGNMTSIKVYSDGGKEIRTLCDNAYLGTEGEIIWDGTDENGNLVDGGIYILYVNSFDQTGKTYDHKLVCAVDY